MNILGASALGIGAVFLILYLRSQQKEIAALIGICTGVVLFAAALPRIAEVISAVRDIADAGGYGETAELLVKALGISAAAQITADICREAGEPTVGTQVEMLARVEIVLLSLPLVMRLLELAQEMLR